MSGKETKTFPSALVSSKYAEDGIVDRRIAAGRIIRISRLLFWITSKFLPVFLALSPAAALQNQNPPKIRNEDELVAALLKADKERPPATRVLLDDHPPLVTARLWDKLTGRAANAYYLESPDRSLELYGIALTVAVRLKDNRRIATTHYNIGRTFSGIGKVQEAIQSYLESKTVFEAAGLQRDLIYVLSDLGSLHLYAQNYRQAKDYSEQSIALAAALTGEEIAQGAWPDQFGVAGALSTLGALSHRDGDYDQAIDHYQRAITLYQELGKDNLRYEFYLADNFASLGRVYRTMGDGVRALTLFNKALNSGRKSLNPGIVANVLNSIGVLYLEQENYEKAVDYLNQSLRAYLAQRNQAETAVALLNLGVAYQRQGDYDRALDSFNRSAKQAEAASGRDVLINAGQGIGVIYRVKGDYPAALDIFERSLSLAKEVEDQTRIAELLWRKAEVFYAMDNFSEAAALSEESLKFARHLRLPKHSYLAATLLGKSLLKQGKNELASKMLYQAIEQIELMRSSVAGQEQERQLYFEDKVAAYHLMIDLLVKQKRTSEAVLYAERAKGRVLLDVLSGGIRSSSLTTDDLSQLVQDRKTALLEYVVAEGRIHMFVLTRREQGQALDVKNYAVSINQAELSSRVNRFYRMVAEKNPGFAPSSRDLYDLLISPAADQLRGKSTIYVIPDGVLWNVPFQALQNGAGRYLIEDCAISYAPSISILKEVKQRRQPGGDSSTLLAFANPFVEAEEVKKGEKFEPLPQAETEVRRLAQFFAPDRRKVFAGPSADEQTFRSLAASYGIIHFATHGMIYNRQPLYSYLLLSKPGADSGYDGLLEAHEIMKLKVRADLVVLSACETAGGRIGAGEGVIGISWAFFVAGSRATVVSQWKVNSSATSELMVGFYQNFKGARSASKADALRLAALKLMNDGRYRHPFYWAGFIIVGDG